MPTERPTQRGTTSRERHDQGLTDGRAPDSPYRALVDLLATVALAEAERRMGASATQTLHTAETKEGNRP